FLFTPLALSVTFAIAASYLVSMTIVPIACAKFLRARLPDVKQMRGKRIAERLGDRLAEWCGSIVDWALGRRGFVVGATLVLFVSSLMLYPWIGKELFPAVDAGQFTVRVR